MLPVPDGTVVKTRRRRGARRPGRRRHDVRRRRRAAAAASATPRSPRPAARRPGFALLGEPGDARDVVLELKTVADVALVGFPSAGKSSLIAAHLRGPAEDRRLPVHHAGAQPRRGRGRRGPLHRRRRARPDPGRQRGQGARPGVPAPRRALLRARARPRLRHPRAGPRPAHRPRRDRGRARGVRRAGRPAAARRAEQDRRARRATSSPRWSRADLEARGLQVFAVSAATHDGLRELSFAHGRAGRRRPGPRRRRRRRPGSCCARRAVDDAGFTRASRSGDRVTSSRGEQAEPLGPPDRLHQRRGRRLPRRPAGPARRRGGAGRGRRAGRATRSSSATASDGGASSTGSRPSAPAPSCCTAAAGTDLRLEGR